MRKITCFLLDILQVIFIFSLFTLLKPLHFNLISNLGGRLGRNIGMKLPHRKRAYQNLKRAMPELSPKKQDEIVAGMFENLTRTLFEYVALPKIQVYSAASRVEVVGQEVIDQLRDDQKPAILFLAHLANWEIGTLAALQRGLILVQVYRKLNYPLTDKLVHWLHHRVASEVITKSQEGARQMILALKEGKHVSMLSDQKMNEGEWIPFFGLPAKTAPAGARLSLKYNCPFVPVRVERIEGTRFRVTYYPPLISHKKTEEEQLTDLLTQMNQLMENWIRERPEQWFWLHRRWPKGHKV
jgi:KDO2-lipid IV(A) lauroyltransferase